MTDKNIRKECKKFLQKKKNSPSLLLKIPTLKPKIYLRYFIIPEYSTVAYPRKVEVERVIRSFVAI